MASAGILPSTLTAVLKSVRRGDEPPYMGDVKRMKWSLDRSYLHTVPFHFSIQSKCTICDFWCVVCPFQPPWVMATLGQSENLFWVLWLDKRGRGNNHKSTIVALREGPADGITLHVVVWPEERWHNFYILSNWLQVNEGARHLTWLTMRPHAPKSHNT